MNFIIDCHNHVEHFVIIQTYSLAYFGCYYYYYYNKM